MAGLVKGLADSFAAQDMNYTIVINGSLWGGALLYYALYARKTFKGPQTTVAQGDEGKRNDAEAKSLD